MQKNTIHEVLNWAFTQELPKVGSKTVSVPGFSPTDILAQYMELGTSVDKTPNGYGVIGGFVYEGEPHPDALVVGRHVRALADREGFEIGAGWNPFPEWPDEHGLIADEVARVVATELGRGGRLSGRHIVGMVTSFAILRKGPDWRAEAPATVPVTRYSQPAWFIRSRRKNRLGVLQDYEDDGFDPRTGRPRKGAYRKYRLDRSIRADILSRLEWQIWQSALEALADSLAGQLSSRQVLPFHPVRAPWLTMRHREENA